MMPDPITKALRGLIDLNSDKIDDVIITEEKPLGARLGEAGFCIVYLIFIFYLAIWMSKASHEVVKYEVTRQEYYRYSFGFLMAFLLGGGDAFHLIPRIIVNIKGKMWKENVFLGAGNLISSITMTIFYNILIAWGDTLEYSKTKYNYWVELAVLILTFIRIVLLLFPQNKWNSKEPNRKWAIIRNVPFVLIGLLVIVGLFNVWAHAYNYAGSMYIILIVLVFFSFAFYLPVALFGKEKPKVGMLMIPKTICYMIMMAVIAFGDF